MGGASIAVLSMNTIDRLNPASWPRINRTRFTVSALFEGYSSEDGTNSAYLSKTHFNGIALAVPVAPDHGIVLGAGISPYSRVNYNIVTPYTLSNFNYQLQYIGEGGISQGYIGLSYAPMKELYFGAKLDYYFGSISHKVKQSFASSLYTDAEVDRSARYNGIGFTCGAVYTGLKNLFGLGEANSLNLGAVLSTTSYLTTTDERYDFFSTSSTLTSQDTVILPDVTTKLPYSFGAGIAYQTEKIIVAGDLRYQRWTQFSVDGVSSPDLRDSYRFGVGVELLPKRETSAPFTQRIAYRFGCFYHSSYYQIHGEPINEFGVSGGFGIPVFGDTRLGISGEYSFRGTTDMQLQKDKILRLSFTLNIAELWFVQPAEE